MASPIRTRLDPKLRREMIEEAAARLFAERGYAATTLDDVAAAAGVTKPVLYRHFASKKALHLALLKGHWQGLRQQILDATAGAGDLQPRLPAILDAWYAYVEEHRYAWMMLFRDTTGDPDIQAFHQQLHAGARAVTRTLIEAQPNISIPAEQYEATAEVIRSATTGLALWWQQHPEIPRSMLVEIMTRTIQAVVLDAAPGAG